MCWVSSFYIVRVRSSIFGFFLTHCTVGLMDTQVKKSLKGNAGENIYIGLVGMPKHQNEKNSSRESKVPT